MKEFLSIIGQGILYVGGFGLYVLGIYHSYDKHNDAEALIWSPFAIYRGAELFFHDNSREWKAELSNVSYFLENMQYDNPPEFNKEFQEFRTKYESFSEEGKKYIKKFARNLLDYRISFLEDVVHSVQRTEYGKKFDLIISDKTKKIRDSLKDFGMTKQLEYEDNAVDKINTMFTKMFDQISFEKFEEIKSQSPENINNYAELYQFAFRRIIANE